MRRIFATALILVSMIASRGIGGGAVLLDKEHQIKAAFIYNFAKFIDWPSEALSGSSPFVVGTYGTEAFNEDLQGALSGKTISGHPIVVQQLRSEGAISKCQIAIVGAADADHIARLAKLCRGTGTVLVGESPGFAQHGGTIGFISESDHIRFEVNLSTAQAANVSISSKLLSLALKVYR